MEAVSEEEEQVQEVEEEQAQEVEVEELEQVQGLLRERLGRR